ncbi:hypothetical protein SprV_0100288800 [Sparganum proliferum]
MIGLGDFLEKHSFVVVPVGCVDFANEHITEEFVQQLKSIPKPITWEGQVIHFNRKSQRRSPPTVLVVVP